MKIKRIQLLQVDIKRYKVIDQQVQELEGKIKSLKEITASKIKRYKPIILLEILQNLKPAGVWFSHVEDETNNSELNIVGGAFDSILIAEFISKLNSTKFQQPVVYDLKTHVYFENIFLERVSNSGASDNGDILCHGDSSSGSNSHGRHWYFAVIRYSFLAGSH